MNVLVVINAKRVWCGGPSSLDSQDNNPALVNALLVVGNVIQSLGCTTEILGEAAQECGVTDAADFYRTLASSPSHTQEYVSPRHGVVLCRLVDCCDTYMILPGFVDSHVHFLDGGKRLSASVSLRGCRSREECATAIRQFIKERCVPAGGWISGGDWSDVLLGGLPDRHWMDDATAEHFVLLSRLDSHCAVVNSKVIDALPELADPSFEVAGGTICRDGAGRPTGLLKEKAIAHVKRRLWPRCDTEENMQASLRAAGHYLTSRGITFVHSMSSIDFDNISEIAFLRDVEQKEGSLPLRVRTAIRVSELDEFRRLFPRSGCGLSSSVDIRPARAHLAEESERRRGGFLRLGVVKFFSDGSLGSRTAAMKQPYRDTCQCGYMLQPAEELFSGIQAAAEEGFQCCIHAIGDAAVATAVKGLVECRDANHGRHRIEHCQHVDTSDGILETMSLNGIGASCQPCHLLFDGDYASDLLGVERKESSSYLFRSFLRSGVPLCFGSDWMVAPADVMDGLRAAVTRVPDTVLPEGRVPWNIAEALTMEESLRAYTYGGAVAGFAEHELGALRPGYLADMVILSQDILGTTSAQDITEVLKSCRVVFTIIDGRVAYTSAIDNVVVH